VADIENYGSIINPLLSHDSRGFSMTSMISTSHNEEFWWRARKKAQAAHSKQANINPLKSDSIQRDFVVEKWG